VRLPHGRPHSEHVRVGLRADHARIAVASTATDARAVLHRGLVDAHTHRRGIWFQAPRFEHFKNLRNARLMTDRWEGIVLRAPRLRWVSTALAVDLIKLLGLRVVVLPIAILDRPLGRDAVPMPILFKIPFAQTKQRRAKELRVAADVIAEARTNL